MRASCLRLPCGSFRRNLRRKWTTAVLSILYTLEDVDYVGDGALVALAARIGTTRLIDNLLL